MNIGRSEYYLLKEKERDLKILLKKIKPFAVYQSNPDWAHNPFVTVAVQKKDAEFFYNMYRKYEQVNME